MYYHFSEKYLKIYQVISIIDLSQQDPYSKDQYYTIITQYSNCNFTAFYSDFTKKARNKSFNHSKLIKEIAQNYRCVVCGSLAVSVFQQILLSIISKFFEESQPFYVVNPKHVVISSVVILLNMDSSTVMNSIGRSTISVRT